VKIENKRENRYVLYTEVMRTMGEGEDIEQKRK